MRVAANLTTGTPAEPSVRPPGATGTAVALLAAVRPRQWPKNLLVVAAPLAAGTLLEPAVLRATLIAFAAFCLTAGALYLFNDIIDAEADRRHPRKRYRPIASGALSVPLAAVSAGVLAVGGLGVAALAGWPLVAVLASYGLLNVGYNLGLKHERVVDLAIVSSGFLLRAVAGGVAATLPLSRWFLIVAAFGSLFIVAGKRYSELIELGEEAVHTRRALGVYTPTYLRFVWATAAAVTITAYCLWAFEDEAVGATLPWHLLSVAPFVLAILRYALDVDLGRAGAPEEKFLRDRVLGALGALWVVVFSLGAIGA